jgi:hypothetical protein
MLSYEPLLQGLPSGPLRLSLKSGSFQTVAACEGLVGEGKRESYPKINPHDVEEKL